MDISNILGNCINIEGVSHEEIASLITPAATSELGDFALPCFRFAKVLRKSPVQIAQDLKDAFCGCPIVKETRAVNGYLNFFIDNVVQTLLTGRDAERRRPEIFDRFSRSLLSFHFLFLIIHLRLGNVKIFFRPDGGLRGKRGIFC